MSIVDVEVRELSTDPNIRTIQYSRNFPPKNDSCASRLLGGLLWLGFAAQAHSPHTVSSTKLTVVQETNIQLVPHHHNTNQTIMTIAVTLNHVHSNTPSRRGSFNSNTSNMNSLSSSPNMKVRPHRKFQDYRRSSGDDSYNNNNNSNINYHNHFLCQPQMLSNGYTVVPMLSLHDALLSYKQQYSSTTRFPQNSEPHYRMSHQTPSGCHGTMMFPSLTPSITTVLPSSSRHETGVNSYITSDESSSLSSNNSRSAMTSTDEARYQLQGLLQHQQQQHHYQGIESRSRLVPKLVRFAPTATMHTLPLVSDDDVYKSWYQAEDYNAFEHDNRQVVLYINNALKEHCMTKDLSKVSMKTKNKHLLKIIQNDPTNLLPYQILGLEQFIYGPKYMYERRQETIHHNMMVLEMYDVQRTTKHYNPTVLRRVSERFSIQKVECAIQRAATLPATTTPSLPAATVA